MKTSSCLLTKFPYLYTKSLCEISMQNIHVSVWNLIFPYKIFIWNLHVSLKNLCMNHIFLNNHIKQNIVAKHAPSLKSYFKYAFPPLKRTIEEACLLTKLHCLFLLFWINMPLMTLKMLVILKTERDTDKGKIKHQKGYLIRQHKAQLNSYIKEGREA